MRLQTLSGKSSSTGRARCVVGQTRHRRSTPLPGGTEDVTSLKRATVGALGVLLKISAPSLKISSEWNL